MCDDGELKVLSGVWTPGSSVPTEETGWLNSAGLTSLWSEMTTEKQQLHGKRTLRPNLGIQIGPNNDI